jgi:hypothetical protein
MPCRRGRLDGANAHVLEFGPVREEHIHDVAGARLAECARP